MAQLQSGTARAEAKDKVKARGQAEPSDSTSTLALRTRLALAVARLIGGPALAGHQLGLSAVSARVDDGSGGWQAFSGGPNDRDAGEIQQLYTDALTAWRKNPLAKRIVDTITDYTLGDGMVPTAQGQMGQFLDRWWAHPKNGMDLRLPDLSDELSRAGDLFITLHRNPADGMSYVRPIPKDRIIRIETLDNDWETEIAYLESPVGQAAAMSTSGLQPRRWLSPNHPAAADADAIMVHYAVNRVVGALLGESDLATMIPWLLRYSRMLEDRVRLHWAARAFLWIVTVPSNMVSAKQEQYRSAPESGSVIVKDSTEEWSAVNPDLKGFDAQFDLRAVRMMIDAGSGLPPHWRGEGIDVNLATATAMERAASRHLRRRQLALKTIVGDLAHIAYRRAWQIGKVRARPRRDAITVATTDLDRQDNRDLAMAARTIAQALETMGRQLPGASPSLRSKILDLVLRFAGEPIDPDEATRILSELPAPESQEEVR
jgi:hypothetical protein